MTCNSFCVLLTSIDLQLFNTYSETVMSIKLQLEHPISRAQAIAVKKYIKTTYTNNITLTVNSECVGSLKMHVCMQVRINLIFTLNRQ